VEALRLSYFFMLLNSLLTSQSSIRVCALRTITTELSHLVNKASQPRGQSAAISLLSPL
jgi:hypothetical protein